MQATLFPFVAAAHGPGAGSGCPSGPAAVADADDVVVKESVSIDINGNQTTAQTTINRAASPGAAYGNAQSQRTTGTYPCSMCSVFR